MGQSVQIPVLPFPVSWWTSHLKLLGLSFYFQRKIGIPALPGDGGPHI